MTPKILAIYVAVGTIHDDRESRPERAALEFRRHSFEPIAGVDIAWAEGHCHTVLPAVDRPTHWVSYAEGEPQMLTYSSGVTVGRFVRPGQGQDLWVADVLHMAREGLGGFALVGVDPPASAAAPTLAAPPPPKPRNGRTVGEVVDHDRRPDRPVTHSGRTAQASLFGAEGVADA